MAQPPATPNPPAPSAPAASTPKPYEIPADTKPVERQELDGGLIVEDFVIGTGAVVQPGGVVTANYHGTLKNGGAAFDSSWDAAFGHQTPATFELGGVIAGWTKGLPGMKVGGLRRLTIPAALAYGPQEKRDRTGKVTIPSNSDLVFVVEMIDTQGGQPIGPKKYEIAADAKPAARQELAGGLVVEDFTVGTGAEVKPGNAVLAFYHGTVKSTGAIFDSAFDRGQPVSFSLGGVIPGWTQGVPGMKVGGLRRLTIPAALAYGANPPPQSGIPANADLVFVIEMVDVIQSEDTKVGTGEEVGQRSICTTSYVMKDAVTGKELDKTSPDNPYVWLPSENVFTLGLIGMHVGGKRVLTVPAAMNKVTGQYPACMNQPPASKAVTIEVELLAVRNLVPVNPKQ
jgi:peptidylprolyl isomerase